MVKKTVRKRHSQGAKLSARNNRSEPATSNEPEFIAEQESPSKSKTWVEDKLVEENEEVSDAAGEEEEDEDTQIVQDILQENTTIDEQPRGVVYLSTVPPFMKPDKLRHLLSQVGDIGRIYLTPEDKSDYKKRKREGGNRKKKYVDGWVEFIDKRKAKKAADILNGTPIGGKKRHNYYRDDIWNLKYLHKFKWSMIKEEERYKKMSRKQKLDQLGSHVFLALSSRYHSVDEAVLRYSLGIDF